MKVALLMFTGKIHRKGATWNEDQISIPPTPRPCLSQGSCLAQSPMIVRVSPTLRIPSKKFVQLAQRMNQSTLGKPKQILNIIENMIPYI